jgi:hypothetical protein
MGRLVSWPVAIPSKTSSLASASRHKLRTIRPLFMAFCIEHGLEYHEAADFCQANFLVLCKLIKETAKYTKTFNE